jgi:hypothetical protein
MNKPFYALDMSVGGIIFGVIHVSGWNLHFPTPIEQVLWRIASLIVTCLLPIALFPYIAVTVTPKRKLGFFLDSPLQPWGLAFGAISVVTRLFILVEAFRTLAFLPPKHLCGYMGIKYSERGAKALGWFRPQCGSHILSMD